MVSSSRYKQWMRKLGDKVSHIFLNESCRGLGLPAVSEFTHKLGMIRGDLFPALVGAQDSPADMDIQKMEESNNRSCLISGVTGLKLNVRPNNLKKIDFTEVVTFNKEISTRNMLEGTFADPEAREEYAKMIMLHLTILTL